MKKAKKIIIILLVVLLLGGGAAGGIYAYTNYQKENTRAEVVEVSSLNWGYSEDAMSSAGYISNDYVQNVYTEDNKIKEVMVAEGDEVKAGDVLLSYDMTELDIQIEMKQLEIQGIANDIELAKRELERLKGITPVPDETKEQDEADEPDEPEEDTKESADYVMIQEEQKDGSAYNYVDKKAKPYKGDGSSENPYRFVCTPEGYVMGSYLNQLVKKEQTAAFEIWSGNNRKKGTLVSCWTVDGTKQESVDDMSRFSVFTHEIIENEVIPIEEEDDEDEPEPDEPENSAEEYTVSELKEAMREKESDLKDLDIDKRSAELSLEKLKKGGEKGTVTAKIDGVVKTVGDIDNPPDDSSPFIEIAGAKGTYVSGEINELMLGKIQVGQEITANSWSNGQTYAAKITEISEYPSESRGGYYGGGNPNASYYKFTAYIEDSDGLTNGDYVDLSMMPVSETTGEDSLFIEKAYVRQEEGRYYVLKAGEDNRLVKQYVQTGKTLYGSAIEIKSGLNMEDRIAFPYGKTAKEGIQAVDSDEM